MLMRSFGTIIHRVVMNQLPQTREKQCITYERNWVFISSWANKAACYTVGKIEDWGRSLLYWKQWWAV